MHNAGGLTTVPSQRRTRRRVKPIATPPAAAGFALARFAWTSVPDEWWLDAFNLNRLDPLLAIPSSSIDGPARRETVRLAHPLAADDAPRLLLRRSHSVSWKDRLGSLRRYARPYSRERREWETLRRLKTLGIDCPRPLVCIEQGLLGTRSALLMEELAGSRTLVETLDHAQWPADSQPRRDFFLALGRHIARLHAAGYTHGALFAPAVLVLESADEPRFGLQHVARAQRHRVVDTRQRAFDVAALDATLPDRLVGRDDRARLLDAYIHESCQEGNAGEFLDQVHRQRERLLARRRVWEIREKNLADDDLERWTNVQSGLWIDPDFRPALEQCGLTTVGSIMQTTQGKCLRTLKDRENWRLDLPHDIGPRGAYLKKHRVRSLGSWWRALLQRGPGDTAGRVEARNIAQLRRAGVAAMRLIAFGEQLLPGGELQSFVLTQELAGFTQLDHFLKQRFAPLAEQTPEQRAALRRLVHGVADLAGKFHHLGYNHRDLYCCHFFIHESAPGDYRVHLIDLQRVEHRKRLRHRWIVKDLAQLSYSAPRDQISCRHKVAFFKRYLGVARLRPQDKRLIRQVLAKQTLMEWQLGKHP